MNLYVDESTNYIFSKENMMSADEALERIRQIIKDFKDDIFDYNDLEALEIAIAALEEKVGR